jgi:hypothetical protein
MEGKHFVWIMFIIAVTAICLYSISLRNKIVLTDPVAQRIWASTHGAVGYNANEVTDLIKEATKATNCDSTAKDNKK